MFKLFFLPLVFLLACRDPGQKLPAQQINFDSLINRQVQILSNQSSSLIKRTSVGQTTVETSLANQQVQWKKELEPFRIISLINKPVYRDSYESSVEPDPRSNLIIKSWVARGDEPLRTIRIFYLDHISQIKKIEARLEETNFVFTSYQDIQLDFTVLGGSPQLERYKISGMQKYFMGNLRGFSLEGIVQ